MYLQPYLRFNANCEDAVEFYQEIFGTELSELKLFRDMPLLNSYPLNSSAQHNYNPDSTKVTFSQLPPKMVDQENKRMTLVIMSDHLNEINDLYMKLKKDGFVETPLQKTDWCKAYAVVIDRFGVEWQLNYQD